MLFFTNAVLRSAAINHSTSVGNEILIQISFRWTSKWPKNSHILGKLPRPNRGSEQSQLTMSLKLWKFEVNFYGLNNLGASKCRHIHNFWSYSCEGSWAGYLCNHTERLNLALKRRLAPKMSSLSTQCAYYLHFPYVSNHVVYMFMETVSCILHFDSTDNL